MSDQQSAAQEDRRSMWRRVVVIGLLLPLVAASLLIWSASGRESNIDRVPVAIVNNDTIITEPQPMAAGRSLTAALTHPATPSKNLKWVLSDEDDATEGLEDGTYYAVLTIPSDFSSAVLSTGTDKPVQGKLKLVSNAAASTTMPYLSQQIATAAAMALGNQVTVGYLGQVYDGFNSLAQGNQQAASGAAQLADGTAQLETGAQQLDSGAAQLSDGLDSVASGSAELADGTDTVSGGATDLRSGVAALSAGIRRLDDGQTRLAAGARSLARQSGGLAVRSRALSGGARLVSGGSRVVAGGARLLTGEVARLANQCSAAGGSGAFCADLARAASHTGALAGAAGRLSTAAGRHADNSSRLASGAGELARATARLSVSARGLDAAGGRLASSSTKLVGGATTLARGASQLDRAAGQLANGTSSTAHAGHSLASGSATLASSAGDANSGAQSLSSGLAQAAAESPTYTKDQANALSAVVSQPIALASQVQHSEHGNGWLIALIVASILWLAALVAALSLDVSRIARNAMAPVASRVVATAQSGPVLGFALLNAVAVIAAVVLFHSSTADLLFLVLLILLGSATFSLLAIALRLRFGGVGVTVFVGFLILQLAASGNVIPLETAPGMLRGLNGVMPLTAFVNGASQLVSGGHVASYIAVVAVLAAWSFISWIALVSAIKHRRMQDTVAPVRVVLSPA